MVKLSRPLKLYLRSTYSLLPKSHSVAAPQGIQVLPASVLFKRFTLPSILFCLAIIQGCSQAPLPEFKIQTTGDKIYRVTYEDLPKNMVKGKRLPLAKMGLFQGGNPVPVWVSDPTQTHFVPGNSFEFLARNLPGVLAHHHEYSTRNIYHLRFDSAQPLRTRDVKLMQLAPEPAAPENFQGLLHLERDKLLMRFASVHNQPYELWYWQKISCTDRLPFQVNFTLDDLSEHAKELSISLNLRGWSRIWGPGTESMPDHELTLSLNGVSTQTHHWDERDSHLIEATFPIEAIPDNRRFSLELAIPKRSLPDGNLAIDVVLLNWVKVNYPQTPRLDGTPNAFHLVKSAADTPVWFDVQEGPHVVFGEKGSRFHIDSGNQPQKLAFPNALSESFFISSGIRGPARPGRVVPWLPGDLRKDDQQVDYLMITHPKLKAAIEPLAEYHSQKGLQVKVVDIRHIYDSFNHGIPHPKAIRDFIQYASENYQKPSPRFVLLVGDASWDSKHQSVRDQNYSDATTPMANSTSFSKIPATRYQNEAEENNRNLIPTANFFDQTGHSASDNYFVSIAGDDIYPDLAIGRLPVTEPEEVTEIVKKTIAFDKNPPVGPWRNKILMITNEEPGHQRRTEKLAREALSPMMMAEKIYPQSQETSNEKHTQGILDAMNQGQSVIFFYGHGGRFIWRTGPPDIKKNHDLFTLDDLEKLSPSTQLPIVLSFTCYSAPFDHPSADSIGEKFLRLKDRGAVAFVGASWRNAPKYTLTKAFLEEFTKPTTVGEALLKGKSVLLNRTLVETYNLLGDPAVRIMPPSTSFELKLVDEGADYWMIEGTTEGEPFQGEGLASVKTLGKTELRQQPIPITGRTFRTRIEKEGLDLSQVQGIQVYIWDVNTQQDWLARLEITPAGVSNAASQP